MIEASAVNFAYRRGIPVLQDITCTIEDGEAVALLGHNGSGKTTLSRLFMALDHPRSGTIQVDQVDIAATSRRIWPIRWAMCSRTRISSFWGIRCTRKWPTGWKTGKCPKSPG